MSKHCITPIVALLFAFAYAEDDCELNGASNATEAGETWFKAAMEGSDSASMERGFIAATKCDPTMAKVAYKTIKTNSFTAVHHDRDPFLTRRLTTISGRYTALAASWRSPTFPPNLVTDSIKHPSNNPKQP